MNWSGRDGDKYTKRNSPDIDKRAKWFDKILPKDIDNVYEIGCNKGQNLVAIRKVRQVKIYGCDLNKNALKIAESKGVGIVEPYNEDLILVSGVLIHQNPIDLHDMFDDLDCAYEYILMIENKEDSIRTINTRWYKNSMWVMDFGKEFLERYPDWEIAKKGWVNGKKPKQLDYTAPLTETKTGFHPDDYYWLIKRRK